MLNSDISKINSLSYDKSDSEFVENFDYFKFLDSNDILNSVCYNNESLEFSKLKSKDCKFFGIYASEFLMKRCVICKKTFLQSTMLEHIDSHKTISKQNKIATFNEKEVGLTNGKTHKSNNSSLDCKFKPICGQLDLTNPFNDSSHFSLIDKTKRNLSKKKKLLQINISTEDFNKNKFSSNRTIKNINNESNLTEYSIMRNIQPLLINGYHYNFETNDSKKIIEKCTCLDINGKTNKSFDFCNLHSEQFSSYKNNDNLLRGYNYGIFSLSNIYYYGSQQISNLDILDNLKKSFNKPKIKYDSPLFTLRSTRINHLIEKLYENQSL